MFGNFAVSVLGTENQAEPPMSPIRSLTTRRKKKACKCVCDCIFSDRTHLHKHTVFVFPMLVVC